MSDFELVDIQPAGVYALETQPRHAVHVGRQQNAVPVNGGAVLECVLHPHGDRIAFAPAQEWAGKAAIDSHRGARIAGEVDRGFTDEQLEIAAGQHLRFAGAGDRPDGRAP
ncbi:hypothetical protein D3C87_1718470 [compost metagenome]